MRQNIFFNETSQLLRLAFGILVLAAFSTCTTSEDETSLEGEDPVEAAEAEVPAESRVPEAPVPEAAPVAPAPSPAAVETSRPAPVPAPLSNTSRRVMYVKTNGVKVFEQPDVSSKVVSKLDKGDHILVELDGEWAKTHDGRYISSSSLSEKGIARSKKSGRWTSGGQSGSGPRSDRSKSTSPSAKPKTQNAAPASTPSATPEAESGEMPVAE